MTDDTEYFDSQEFQDILSRYEQAVRQGHAVYMDSDDLADIADYYQYQGRPEDADAAVDLALRLNPDAVGPLLYKSRSALLSGDYALAQTYAERIRPLDELEYLYMHGEILISQGNTDEADQMFRQRYRDTPPDELADYVYDVANLYADYDYHEKAMEWMSRSQADDSDDFKELMARTLFGLGKYEDSSRLFNELIDEHPFSKYYWNALASAQFMNEDYGASVTSSEYAIAIDPDDPEAILAKANGLYSLENYEEALKYFERYSEKAPLDELGFLRQGTCLINLGRHDEAIARLEQGRDLVPDDSPYLPDLYQELAFAYCEKHMPETAIYYLDKTKELDCDHADMEVVRGHILLANKRITEAEKAFKHAIRMSSFAPRTMMRVIVSLLDNRLVKAAYRLLKGFLAHADSDWNEGYAYMALCCYELDRDGEFLQYLQTAVEKNPREARVVLGDLFPADTKPAEYVDYIKEKMNIK